VEKTRYEDFNDLHSSPNTIWVIKSRIMCWAGHVAHVRERRRVYTYRILVGGNLREGDHLKTPGLDGRIILRWMFRRCDGGMG
jgi:hypothetical protein